MLGHWQTLLEGIVADAQRRLGDLPLLTHAERHQLLVEWNETRKVYPEFLVHQLFQAQAERILGAVAVRYGQQELTYRELDHRTNQLARRLKALGVGPEMRVGLCVERSPEMIVGILGILKAGGAYVPLHPAYPQQRLALMLQDSEVSVLLTQSKLRAKLPPRNFRLVFLDAEWSQIARESEVAPDCPATHENPAYVMYTSGSTGLPKGVLITHRNLAQSTGARLNYYSERVGNYLLLPSFAFDSSVAGIFLALCGGGTLCLPPESFQGDPEELSELISQNCISQMLCFPSLYGLLLEHAQPKELASLRTVVVAGEPCPSELVERHYALLPAVPLFNEYGPTEATVWSTVYRCHPRQRRTSVPIGRPIPNTQCYVLDPHLNPVPVGVPGELYLGGDGLARGYLNRPELTHQKFTPNPFSDRPGERLYKTGDRVRYLPDGNLEFLGRVDNQVKVRGLRIELGEIEKVLAQHAAVREVVVLAREDQPGNKRLVAYVVSRPPSVPRSDELRGFLKSRLPHYMIPSAFVMIEALPHTPSGKVDRQALTAPEEANRGREEDLVPPRDKTEARLLKIWQIVFGRRDIGVTQDFFELGGHSLLAARLLRRMEKEFDRKFTLVNVFEAPSIEQMSNLVRQPDSARRSSHLVVPIQSMGSRLPLFCVRGGPRFRLLAQQLGSDQPVFGLHLNTTEARGLPFPYRVEDIASRLVEAMREVQPEGPYHLSGLCVNGVIAYEMAHQLVTQGEEVELLAMFDAQNAAFYKKSFREGRAHSLVQRAAYHSANLIKLDWKAKGPYVVDRLREARRRTNRIIWQIAYELQWRADETRIKDAEAIVFPAASVYQPQPYPGRVVMFQSTKWPEGAYFDFALSWRDLVAGGIEVHRIPGNHASMFREPNVDTVASKLCDFLHKSQQVRAEETSLATVGSRV
jgi:aspartate racemase